MPYSKFPGHQSGVQYLAPPVDRHKVGKNRSSGTCTCIYMYVYIIMVISIVNARFKSCIGVTAKQRLNFALNYLL